MWSVLAIATLVTWLIAGAAGIYMFGTWLSHGGPGHQRARSDGLPPAVIFTHLGFGALGFVAWVSYVVTGLDRRGPADARDRARYLHRDPLGALPHAARARRAGCRRRRPRRRRPGRRD